MPDTIANIAKTVETVVTDVHDALPYLEGLTALVPQFGPQLVIALKLADSFREPILAVLHHLYMNNGNDLPLAAAQLSAHLSSQMPNLAILNGKPGK